MSNFRVPVAGVESTRSFPARKVLSPWGGVAAEDRDNLCAGRLSIPSAYLRASIRQRRELSQGSV